MNNNKKTHRNQRELIHQKYVINRKNQSQQCSSNKENIDSTKLVQITKILVRKPRKASLMHYVILAR